MSGLNTSRDMSAAPAAHADDVCVIQGADGGIVVGVPVPGDTLCPLKVIFEEERFRGVISEQGQDTELFSLDTSQNSSLKAALTRCLTKARHTRRMPSVSVWRMVANDVRAFGNVSFIAPDNSQVVV